jgi:hypothetical protein
MTVGAYNNINSIDYLRSQSFGYQILEILSCNVVANSSYSVVDCALSFSSIEIGIITAKVDNTKTSGIIDASFFSNKSILLFKDYKPVYFTFDKSSSIGLFKARSYLPNADIKDEHIFVYDLKESSYNFNYSVPATNYRSSNSTDFLSWIPILDYDNNQMYVCQDLIRSFKGYGPKREVHLTLNKDITDDI